MNELFCKLFNKEADFVLDGAYFLNSDADSDCFDDDDVKQWRNDTFCTNWHRTKFLKHPVSEKLIEAIVKRKHPVIELACGPGMGLIPSIKQLNPQHSCLATDASSLVIKEWKNYLFEYEQVSNLDFAQFSVLDIPFKDNLVSAYSSFIGLSSTRSGSKGYDKAISEVHRTLKRGGYLYTVENEWTNVSEILDLFKMMNKQPWNIFFEQQKTWRERFLDAGFCIEYEDIMEYRALNEDDNELGEAAHKYGKNVGIKSIAYILRKEESYESSGNSKT